MTPPDARRSILYLDRDHEDSHEFRHALSHEGPVLPCNDLESVLGMAATIPESLVLLDTATLLESPTAQVTRLQELRGAQPVGLVTSQGLEEYIGGLRDWGLLQAFVKLPPIDEYELSHFLRMVEDPRAGFGLISYLSSTVQMFSVSISTMREKLELIERVTNHFATCGFAVHDLYNVRLILEEMTNNAFFHAFRTPAGEEKYSISTFEKLEPGEQVRIEYGSDGEHVGFSVTDNAGALPVPVILDRLERQLHQEGVLDESGRGLHLSRLLARRMVINLDPGKRTQMVAVFDMERRPERPRPFVINALGEDTFSQWRNDPDLD